MRGIDGRGIVLEGEPVAMGVEAPTLIDTLDVLMQ